MWKPVVYNPSKIGLGRSRKHARKSFFSHKPASFLLLPRRAVALILSSAALINQLIKR